MSESRSARDRDGLLGAELCGIADYHARWHELTEEEAAAAVTQLREIAGGRSELLAEKAGVLLGF